MWKREFGRADDAIVRFPELRVRSQCAQDRAISSRAHNQSLIDQRQRNYYLSSGGGFYIPPRPSQPQAFRKKFRPRAEPQTSPLQVCADCTKPKPATLLHDPGGRRYWLCATWRVRCERVRRRTSLQREAAPSVVGVLQRGRSVGGGGPFKLSPTRNPEKPDPPGPTVAGDVDHVLIPKGQRVESRVFSCLRYAPLYAVTQYTMLVHGR